MHETRMRDIDDCARTGVDVARLALSLGGIRRVETLLDRLPACLLASGPDLRWAVLARLEKGRYRASATPGVTADDLRLLADDACGDSVLLAVGRLAPDDGEKGVRRWCAVPSTGGPDPTLVLGVWAGGKVAAPGRSCLDTVARLIGRALEAAAAFEALTEQATHDPLTGLFNRRGILEQLERERSRSLRYGRPLSVLYIDLDRFKEVNDRYGHHVGDEILVKVAGVLGSALRTSDALGRIGGDEFVALLPDTELASALSISRRLARRVVSKPLPTSRGSITVSVTVGVSGLDEESTSAALLRNADREMLVSKSSRAREWRPRSHAGGRGRAEAGPPSARR